MYKLIINFQKVSVMERRITDLEMRFMQQQNILEDLDATVCQQALTIDRLQRELALIKDLCRTFTPSINRTPDEEEPPPHY